MSDEADLWFERKEATDWTEMGRHLNTTRIRRIYGHRRYVNAGTVGLRALDTVAGLTAEVDRLREALGAAEAINAIWKARAVAAENRSAVADKYWAQEQARADRAEADADQLDMAMLSLIGSWTDEVKVARRAHESAVAARGDQQ